MAEENSTSGKIGITASIQDSQTGIMVPIWISNSLVITPVFSIASISDVLTDIGIAVGPRLNLHSGDAIPFIGFRIGGLFRKINEYSEYNEYSEDNKEKTQDLLISSYLGGEYFISDNFSVGVEVQFNYVKSGKYSNRFANPGGTNINTATAVTASFYF